MNSSFTIVIPMAGLGSRMRPHTWTRPKPLLYLAGKTVLDHSLDQFTSLPRVDQAKYIFIVSPNQGDQIQEHMQKVHPDKEVHYVVQEQMRGQSDAISLAREFIHGPTLIAFSDTLIETDLAFLEEETSDGIAWVKTMPDPRRFGVVETNAEGWAIRLIEKPQDISKNNVVVGFYYFHEGAELIHAVDEQVKRGIQLGGEYFLSDAINLMLEHGACFQTHQTEVWLDAGIPEALLETNQYLLDHGAGNQSVPENMDSVTIVSPVFIAPGAHLKCSVIGPHVTLGEGCTITNSVIRNSIIGDGTQISDIVLESSLIGRDVNLRGRAEKLNIGDNSWMEM